jgi:hypothetical protein
VFLEGFSSFNHQDGIEMNKDVERKLKIENLTRCINCLAFVVCCESRKEDIADCVRFKEVGLGNQVTVFNLRQGVQR